jgi:hypothetical protein
MCQLVFPEQKQRPMKSGRICNSFVYEANAKKPVDLFDSGNCLVALRMQLFVLFAQNEVTIFVKPPSLIGSMMDG